MKKTSLLLLAMFMALALGSCNNEKPMYVYIDCETLELEPKPSLIVADDDVTAFYNSFEAFSENKHDKVFYEILKTKEVFEGGSEACESDEADQGAIPVSETDGVGELLPTGDSDEAGEYTYSDLLDPKNSTPNFKLYKITDKDARKVAQDFIDKKISFEEFQTKVKDKAEVIYDNEQHKDIYEKEFKKCKEIDYNSYAKMRDKFNKSLQAAAQKKEQEQE
ncbi:MAG: hypothetical protein J6X22_01385 [Muribaculaceae bacterium]|nr:hypothetical protein [Muribaculaceae bacterium]